MAKKKDTKKTTGPASADLEAEVKRLKKENADLRKRLDKIAGLADVADPDEETDDEEDLDDEEMLDDDEDLEDIDEEDEEDEEPLGVSPA